MNPGPPRSVTPGRRAVERTGALPCCVGKSLRLQALSRVSTALFAGGAGSLAAGAATTPTRAPRTKPDTITSTCTGSIFCFMPMNKSVAVGDTMKWTNTSFAPHELALCTPAVCEGVTSGTGTQTGFGSGAISSGQTYSFTFDSPGTYTYYCTIHGYATMHGTITVDSLPTIKSVSPALLAPGMTNQTLMVRGSGFRDHAQAHFTGTGVTVSSVVRVDSSHLMLTVSVSATAMAGGRHLVVTNYDGGNVKMAHAITVS